MVGELGALEVEQPEELRVELRLQTADRDRAAVGGRVDVVEGRTTVEQVRSPLARPEARVEEAEGHRHQERRAVGHRRVDDLATSGGACLEHGADDAEGEHHAPAAEVADQVERRHREAPGPADGRERPRQGDVVDVVTRLLRQRARLAPPRHPAVDETLVPRAAGVRAQPEPLHDSGAEALDQRIRLLDEPEHDLRRLALLEVERNRGTAARERGLRQRRCARRRTVDPDHIGPEVGEQHGRERRRADPGELDDLQVSQRPLSRAAHSPPRRTSATSST